MLALTSLGQSKPTTQIVTKPKLIIGIVVDQMRNDYIYRYWNRFGNGGFKKLVTQGYYFKNAHFNYIPTYTGPGHSSIYTGTTPRTHGIIANEWFDKNTKKEVYCVTDTAMKTIGSSNKSGQVSPKNQISSTIGDELLMSSNQQSKVFGIALKDRSAVLPAGHAAQGAFWLDEQAGNFVSSSWYCNELPAWVNTFNEKKIAKMYLEKGWETIYPISTYTNSIADLNTYESVPNKQDKPIFPYNYKNYLEKNNVGIIRATPYGNSITKDLALACIKAENLGKDDFTDLLCLSFSSTDIVAHSYGPRAVEVEDIYLRLDKDLEELINFLEKEVGKNNFTLFLTADHGGADVPRHLLDNKIPAGYIKEKKLQANVKAYFQKNYNDSTLVVNISNEQIFLDTDKIDNLKLNKDDVENKLCSFLITQNGIAEAFPSTVLKFNNFDTKNYASLLQNGYKHNMSGNVAYILNPAWMDYAEKGTTHGAGYNYDTHVPIIFYGNSVPKGENYNYITITQIAPTVCELIQINQTNGCTALPLQTLFEKK